LGLIGMRLVQGSRARADRENPVKTLGGIKQLAYC
jgi:hypothetical protein